MTRLRQPTIALAVLAIAAGTALRGWRLAHDPLWLDEAYSAFAAAHDMRFLWRVVPVYETHPPLYYTLLHAWVLLFGDGLRSLRLPGFIAGLATLPVVAATARECGVWLGWSPDRRRWLGLIALALASLSMPLVEMAREVRPYPLIILTYAACILLLLRLARRVTAGRGVSGWDFAAYCVLLELLLWLHNLDALFALALTIALTILLVRRPLSRRDWLWLAAGHALVALGYLPCLLMLRAQAAVWVNATWLHFSMDELFFDRVLTLYAVPGWPALAALALAGSAALVLARRHAQLLAALLLLALLPLLLVIVASLLVTPLFITRTMTPLAMPAILLLAIGAVGAPRRLVGAGALLILAASLLAANIQLRIGGPMQDWYRTVDWLAQRFRPGDQIFAYPNEGKLPLGYALRDRSLSYPIRAIPADVPALEVRHGIHPSGTRGVSSLPQADLDAIANEPATRAVLTIWLLRLGRETFDPGDGFLRALHRDRFIVRHWHDGPIDIVGLRKRDLAVRSAPTPVRSPR